MIQATKVSISTKQCNVANNNLKACYEISFLPNAISIMNGNFTMHCIVFLPWFEDMYFDLAWTA